MGSDDQRRRGLLGTVVPPRRGLLGTVGTPLIEGPMGATPTAQLLASSNLVRLGLMTQDEARGRQTSATSALARAAMAQQELAREHEAERAALAAAHERKLLDAVAAQTAAEARYLALRLVTDNATVEADRAPLAEERAAGAELARAAERAHEVKLEETRHANAVALAQRNEGHERAMAQRNQEHEVDMATLSARLSGANARGVERHRGRNAIIVACIVAATSTVTYLVTTATSAAKSQPAARP